MRSLGFKTRAEEGRAKATREIKKAGRGQDSWNNPNSLAADDKDIAPIEQRRVSTSSPVTSSGVGLGRDSNTDMTDHTERTQNRQNIPRLAAEQLHERGYEDRVINNTIVIILLLCCVIATLASLPTVFENSCKYANSNTSGVSITSITAVPSITGAGR